MCLKETTDALAKMNILCILFSKTENAIEGKIDSKINLEIRYYKKIKKDSEKKNATISLRATARFLIPDVDNRRNDSRNIL